MNNQIKKINKSQRDNYERVDLNNSKLLLNRYANLLHLSKFNHKITILDVGGASGFFTKKLCEYLRENNFEVTAYVLDTMRYSNWDDKFDNDIVFYEGSVEHIDTYFRDKQFDLIFCNKVFHHFVTETYKGTIHMIENCMNKLQGQLSEKGMLCILDYFYNGLIIDSFPSWMIYRCTSQKNRIIMKVFRKMGAKSVGSGVCFQSEKMWRELIKRCQLEIKVLDKGPIFPMKVIKQIVFLSHKPIEDCIFICARQ